MGKDSGGAVNLIPRVSPGFPRAMARPPPATHMPPAWLLRWE
jgi:hypothetical protein